MPFAIPSGSACAAEAEDMTASEPILASFLYSTILNHREFNDAVAYHLAQKLGNAEVHPMQLRELFDEALREAPEIGEAYRADIVAYYERDPACHSYIQPLLYFKGFHSLQAYRVAHWLWGQGRKAMALYIQNRISDLFAVDIHPAARLGSGLFLDHGTGIVIGETAVVGDECRCCMASRWAVPARSRATVTQEGPGAAARLAPRCSAISRSANTAASRGQRGRRCIRTALHGCRRAGQDRRLRGLRQAGLPATDRIQDEGEGI